MAQQDTDNTKNTNQFKTKSELVTEAKNRSLKQEIDNDVSKFDTAFKRPDTLKQQNATSTSSLKQEQDSAAVLGRVTMVAATCDLQIKNEKGEYISASKDPLPVATYLSHGGRINVVGASPQLMNWITTGNPDTPGHSYSQTQAGAIKEDKIVYNRSAATHNVERKELKDTDDKPKLNDKGETQYEYTEKQGFFVGAKSFAKNKILGEKTRHFGVDLALNVNDKGYDPQGKKVNSPDGDHGHLYIHHKEQDGNKKGTMLLGIEGAAPSSEKHSKFGTPDPLSAVGSGKWKDVEDKQKQAPDDAKYKNALIPQELGAARIEMNPEKEKALFAMDPTKYPDLAKAYPAQNAQDFKKNYEAKNFHTVSEQKSATTSVSTGKSLENKAPQSVSKGIKAQIHTGVSRSQESISTSKAALQNAGKGLVKKMQPVLSTSQESISTSKAALQNAGTRFKEKMEGVTQNTHHNLSKATKTPAQIMQSASKALRENKALHTTSDKAKSTFKQLKSKTQSNDREK